MWREADCNSDGCTAENKLCLRGFFDPKRFRKSFEFVGNPRLPRAVNMHPKTPQTIKEHVISGILL